MRRRKKLRFYSKYDKMSEEGFSYCIESRLWSRRVWKEGY